MVYFVAGLNEQTLTRNICKNLKGNMLKRKLSWFTGGELNVCVENKNLKGKKIYIVLSIFGGANDRAMELFLLADAIKNLGGRNITAIIPYFGYARQDKATQGEAFSLRCLAKLIEASGIKKIITLDLHTPKSIKLFDIPVVNLATTAIFQKAIQNKNNTIIISPDIGATLRAKMLATALEVSFIVAKKKRTESNRIKIIEIPQIETVTNKDCYLVDDILDTGQTICAVASKLKKFKPKSIHTLISHGIFGNGTVQVVKKSGIEKIYVTDSVNYSVLKRSKVYILKSSSIISDFLKNNGE